MRLRAELPDVVMDLDEDARDRRCVIGDANCALDDARFFLRGELALGEQTLSLWVELADKKSYKRALALWGHERRGDEPAIACTLANELPGLPGTLGAVAILTLGARGTAPRVERVA